MTSDLSSPQLKSFADSVHTIRCVHPLTYAPRPSTLGMSLALGTKAKLAITNSLGKLNQKLRNSSFASPGTYSGVIQNQSAWSVSEQRVWVVVLVMGVALLYGNRISLPLALPQLVKHNEGYWDLKFQNIFLGAFYWGMLCSPLLGHYLANRHGGEVVQWVSALGWSLTTLLTVQFTAYTEVVGVMRFLSGFLQGFHIPALLSIVSRRVTEKNRAFVFGGIASSAPLGSVLVGGISSPQSLSSAYFFPSLACVGVAWALLVRWLLQRSMKHHKTHYKLSEGTRGLRGGGGSGLSMANGGLTGQMLGGRERLKLEVQPVAVKTGSISRLPWGVVLRSPPVIVLFVAHFSSSFFLHLAMSWLPSLWNQILDSSPENGHWVCNVLPWVAMTLNSGLTGWCCHWLLSRSRISLSATRCALTSVSLGGSAVFLLTVAIVMLSGRGLFPGSLVAMSIAFAFHGLSVGGSFLNPLDLAPSHADVLFSTMETVGALAGVAAVHSTGIAMYLAEESPKLGTSSAMIFISLAFLNVVSLILYLVFGTGQVQQWDSS